MTRVMIVATRLLAVLAAAWLCQPTSAQTEWPDDAPERRAAPKGFVWLVGGCSISLAVQELTASLFDHFSPPDVHALRCGELWNKAFDVYDEILASNASGVREDHRVSLVDLLIAESRLEGAETERSWNRRLRCKDFSGERARFALDEGAPPSSYDAATAGEGDEKKPFHLVAKLTPGNYFDRRLRARATDLDVSPPPFVLAAMVRSNLVEYVACLLRDQEGHGVDSSESPVAGLAELGYVVDARTGEPIEPAEEHPDEGEFRAEKGEYRAVLDVSRLPELLAEISAYNVVSKQNILRDMRVPATVYPSDDLIDLSSEARVQAAAEIYLSLLARSRVVASLDNVTDFLRNFARNSETPPCDLSTKIYNLEEVRKALQGTTWERYAYCPDEWARLHGG